MKTFTQITLKIIFIVTVIYCDSTVFAQNDQSIVTSASSGMVEKGISPKNRNFDYTLQLFPGQAFEGSFYFWVNRSTTPLTSNWIRNNEFSDWLLDFEPKSFTLGQCEIPIRMKFLFQAPQEEGEYKVSLFDTNSNWDPLDVTLIVTTNPIADDSISLNVLPGETSRFRDPTHEYNGVFAGCDQPIFLGSTQNYVFKVFPDTSTWFSVDKDSFVVAANGSEDLIWDVSPNSNEIATVYLVKDIEWRSQLRIIKITNIPQEVSSVSSYENDRVQLGQSYPNPVKTEMVIPFFVKEADFYTLQVCDFGGKVHQSFGPEFYQSGENNLRVNIEKLPAGVYYYRLMTVEGVLGRMFVVK